MNLRGPSLVTLLFKIYYIKLYEEILVYFGKYVILVHARFLSRFHSSQLYFKGNAPSHVASLS